MSTAPRLSAVPATTEQSPRVTVVTQATARGRQPTAVRTLHPVTGGGRTQIAVRVGPILIMVADREALDSFVHAWRQAEEMARGGLPSITVTARPV